MIQLNPAIPVFTPKGRAVAHALIDYGMEQDICWVCFQDTTGECWTWRNEQVRAQKNITHGRAFISPFYNPDDVAFKNDEEDEDEEDDEDENEYDERQEEIHKLRLEKEQCLEQIKKQSESINCITKSVLEMQELLLDCMRKKNFEKFDFTNMFGCLRRSGMSESDIKTLSGMTFGRF